MNAAAQHSQVVSVFPSSPWPGRVAGMEEIPWVPLAAGKSFKPLRFLGGDRGFVELLRLEPGTAIPLHRHTGEVHAFNLEGSRRLHTGEIVGPGDYVFEPAGNTDSWSVVGDVPLVVFVVVMGAVEYLAPDGSVMARYTAQSLLDSYREHCVAHGLEIQDLVD